MIIKNGDRTITLAETAGFCFGVKRAMEIALDSAPAATLGPLIHNEAAVARLREEGVSVINNLGEADGLPVIIRSHGEGKATYEDAKAKGIELIDATCPFVEKIHRIVSETDRQVVIAGDPDHAEVRGIAGWCPDDRPALVFQTAEEAKDRLPLHEGEDGLPLHEILLVAQTTIKQETFDGIYIFLVT